MSTSMTFNSLQSDIQAYLERGYPNDTTVAAQIPGRINLAERAIASKLKIQGFINNIVLGLVAGKSVYPKPNRWRETISMNYGAATNNNSRTPLLARQYAYCRSYWPDSSVLDAAQPPLYYADYNYSWWLIVPTPPLSYPWEVNYYEQPPLLGDDVQTNWLTNYAPNLLLYRALIEMEPFLKNDERIATWRGMYQEQLDDLDVQDLQKTVDQASVRSKA